MLRRILELLIKVLELIFEWIKRLFTSELKAEDVLNLLPSWLTNLVSETGSQILLFIKGIF